MTNEKDLEVSRQDIELIDELLRAEAREKFLVFRHYIRPELQDGWFVRDVTQNLQSFYKDFVAGKRPKQAIEAPPQHGKSWAVTDFIAWVAGNNPDKKTIFGSYSDDLGVRTNLDLQRIMTSQHYGKVFPKTMIGEPGWQCNTTLLEYAKYPGSFRNTTVAGQINGMELHLGVIDDPFKGRAEAQSVTIRNKTWDWFADDFMSRFAKDGALLVVMTRWHVDDLLGRFIAKFKDEVRVLRYPAIAEEDEFDPETGKLRRRKGEALFPQHKPLAS